MSEDQRLHLSRIRRGEQNPNWKLVVKRGHPRELEHWTKTGVCEECGVERGNRGRGVGTEWSFLRHPDPYTREREDYRELCRSCHMKFDVANGTRDRQQLIRASQASHARLAK